MISTIQTNMITPEETLALSAFEDDILDLIEKREKFTQSDLQGAVGAIVIKLYRWGKSEGLKSVANLLPVCPVCGIKATRMDYHMEKHNNKKQTYDKQRL